MKKTQILTIALIISLIFGFYNFFIQKEQKRVANEVFKSNLQTDESCFVYNYNIMSDDEKNSNYLMASSGLKTALSISQLTSYNYMGRNKALVTALSDLARCMNRKDSRWQAVTEKASLLYKYLTYIRENPNDKDSCKSLSKIANDLISSNK
ncbi:hypothetical protein G9F71_025110 [Clostridium sp. FP2]|uniref:hypothetical protein n=1 Tax=Clostridium sp. FP2 TaxID=2724481 RepID=UPI0013E97288|nr:hypothetical protein [Clostridium sp. FP2]MBZ9626089.1 hypothetical protein [Clostridium sp. FP2]